MVTKEEMYKDIRKMLVLISAFTEPETQGEDLLSEWGDKYKKQDLNMEENEKCNTVFIPKGVCTVILEGVTSGVELSKENGGTTIEILDSSLPCQGGHTTKSVKQR